MRHYELMVILDPSLDERTVQPSLETFLNVIRTDGEASRRSRCGASAASPTRSTRTPRASTRCSRSRASPPRSRSSTASWGSTSPCCAPRCCGASRSARPSGCRELRSPWQAKPSSPSSATSPPTPSCGSPRRGPRSPTSPSPRRRATSTASPASGRTARRCSCAATCGARRRRTWPRRSPAACG